MNQKIFDARQRVSELMEEAVSVWKESSYSSQLLSLKDDPVFKLILSAVAYQYDELDNDIERIKGDILRDYADMLMPYYIGHATPATAVIKTMPVQGVGVVDIDSRNIFTLENTDFVFTPVMHTKVLPVSIKSVVRLDGRRWEVNVAFDTPVSDLSYMSFALRNPSFHDLKVSVEGKKLPLVRPWEFGDLPFSEDFAFANVNSDSVEIFDPSMELIDLFAKQGLRVYYVNAHSPQDYYQSEIVELKLLFEFEGVTADFKFDGTQLIFNPVILANARINEVTLDASHPISRITGAGLDPYAQLVHIMNAGNDQIYGDMPVFVRKVAADRFNQASIMRVLSSLLGKFHSDYYAFADLDANSVDEIISGLEMLLKKLATLTDGKENNNIAGTYVMLDNAWKDKSVSVNVRYITTAGAVTEQFLNENSHFVLPAGLDSNATSQIVPPEYGTDEVDVKNGDVSSEQIKYYIHTNNRIVTANDIRVFCYKELASRYGIISNMVKGIKVGPRLCDNWALSGNNCGYEIAVDVEITDTPYIRRNFIGKIPQIEVLMEKMLQVRSTNIYPIVVKIEIK